MTSIPVSPSEPTPVPVSDPNDQTVEIPDHEFFPHPVWLQRWYNPEFTDEGRAKWEAEPWYESTAQREPHRILRRPTRCFPWGFFIYRTVYTAESDRLWPLAIEKLTRVLGECIEGDLKFGRPNRRGADDPRPEQLAQASHKDAVIYDADHWDGASIDLVRDHFAEYLRKTNQVECGGEQRLALCLVIDERALKSIIAPEDSVGFVGTVDGRYDSLTK
ncbi:uncharacterized protein N7503_008435 [Penicillium pulvis]|uniref:uncharacterized protein n=1 Tax=Penicillium pulvis TaxID=1562058 RepID=UPI002548043A|nr:uncharacterized protein N7503_008435 [Penicillium pulvis]KAJ5792457.1 hypothetical protein N7503_008435 [Penicillium pulvis]